MVALLARYFGLRVAQAALLVCGLVRAWVSWNFDRYIFMLGPLTALQSRGGDGNGSSPVVLSGRSQPGGADLK